MFVVPYSDSLIRMFAVIVCHIGRESSTACSAVEAVSGSNIKAGNPKKGNAELGLGFRVLNCPKPYEFENP